MAKVLSGRAEAFIERIFQNNPGAEVRRWWVSGETYVSVVSKPEAPDDAKFEGAYWWDENGLENIKPAHHAACLPDYLLNHDFPVFAEEDFSEDEISRAEKTLSELT